MWTWDAPTQAVLHQLPLYQGNPYTTLASLSDDDLDRVATPAFRELVAEARASQERYLAGSPERRSVAYFSAEYGIDPSLPIYSGGLGVLAADHLKSASDLAVPLVAVGLFYRQGYFRQALDGQGRQREEYPRIDPAATGLRQQLSPDGTALVVAVPLGDRQLLARVWRADVGRVPLYLLDSDFDGNTAASDREVTQQLYGGDRDMRIRQEILLGIGGVRALRALGYATLNTVHLNEGHAAFVLLELIAEAMRTGMDYDQARAHARRHAVFTTHTPVPAGHDCFDHPLLLYYLGPWWRDEVGCTDDELVALGGGEPPFSMTELALNVTRAANAVSAKHGEVTRAMFPCHAIGSITNGVHHPTWTGPRCAALYDELLPGWREDSRRLRRAELIPLERVRKAHGQAKRDLIAAISAQRPRDRLDEEVLTIGFARRMAAYKRATLLFHDPGRLEQIARRGLQVVFAGKAHPHDGQGKGIIADVVRHTSDSPARIVFLEDYDMRLARTLIAGVDVWLNNPLRPYEASGTSGMKALLNGVPNLSVLDGWWIEGYAATNGWAIGGALPQTGDEGEDARDANSLYAVLERDVLPEYYDRPEDWATRMRRAIATSPGFTTQRMVAQYASEVYAL